MSRWTGAVRFNDGELRYFVWNSSVSIAHPKLFLSEREAGKAWRCDEILVVPESVKDQTDRIEVMPYFCAGDREVLFESFADRKAGWITGPISDEDAYRQGLYVRNFE
jgi:hypothetical protein